MLICDKCERPLSRKYFMHVFHANGREQKIYCGVAPEVDDGNVYIYVDVDCEAARRAGNKVIVDGGRKYTMRDIDIRRTKNRILMVLPRV